MESDIMNKQKCEMCDLSVDEHDHGACGEAWLDMRGEAAWIEYMGMTREEYDKSNKKVTV